MIKIRNQILITYFFLIVTMLCWGLSFVWYKQALLNFKPIILVFLRLLISIPLLVTIGLALNRLKKIQLADIPKFLVLAFLEPFLYFIGESFGIVYISSSAAAVLIATIPIFTSIIAHLFAIEKLSAVNYTGILLSFTGVLAIVMFENKSGENTGKGIAILFISVVAATLYGFLVKKIALKYNPFTIVTVQNILGTIYFIPLFFLLEYKYFNPHAYSLEMFTPILYLSVFATTIAYLGFINGIKNLGVSRATVFANFIPVVTAVFALIILNEELTYLKTAGIAFVVSGLILSQKTGKDKKKKEKEVVINELY